MFDASTHNEKIKHVYGNYNFWSWLRYWYLDSCNYVTMLLLDKGYYDYDYEKTESPREKVKWEDTIRTDEEVRDMLAGFGFGNVTPKPQTEEEIQVHIINQIKED